jgi:hypothetical protein
MDFADCLYDFLSKNATITAAVGTRIYPVQFPQGAATPALVYREMYTEDTHAMQVDDDLQRPSFEIECHADTYRAARAVIRTLRSVLRNYSGLMGNATVQAVLISGGAEDMDPDTGKYWKSKEFEFFMTEV